MRDRYVVLKAAPPRLPLSRHATLKSIASWVRDREQEAVVTVAAVDADRPARMRPLSEREREQLDRLLYPALHDPDSAPADRKHDQERRAWGTIVHATGPSLEAVTEEQALQRRRAVDTTP
jgi:hypothetical protein